MTAVLIVIGVILTCYAIVQVNDYIDYNGGRCKNCGAILYMFGTDRGYSRGYKCSRHPAEHGVVWISCNWDKKHDHKIASEDAMRHSHNKGPRA
jgi:hypothetical protein